MTDLAPAEWVWEQNPEVELAEPCANGSCEKCDGLFTRDDPAALPGVCGHPCHGIPGICDPDAPCKCKEKA